MDIALNILHDRTLREALEWWRLADRSGVHTIAVADSPALLRELYVCSALCAEHTSRAIVMSGVTNPVSRDPSVTASALLTLSELAPGRVALGIGTGDSALWGVGRKPATVARLREYVLAVKALLRGEAATYDGRTWRARWAGARVPVDVPVVVPAAGPKVLRMAAEVADGMLLSMGFGEDNVAHVNALVEEGCRAAGRSVEDLQLWWNSEIVFGDSVEDAREHGLGVSTSWLTMGSLEGKQIPDDLRNAVIAFNRDVHDLATAYQAANRDRALVARARELGIYDWLVSRAPGLWGTPDDVAARLRELEARGMTQWMFYVGRGQLDRGEHVRRICEEVIPRLAHENRVGTSSPAS